MLISLGIPSRGGRLLSLVHADAQLRPIHADRRCGPPRALHEQGKGTLHPLCDELDGGEGGVDLGYDVDLGGALVLGRLVRLHAT